MALGISDFTKRQSSVVVYFFDKSKKGVIHLKNYIFSFYACSYLYVIENSIAT